ncbi:hypothetical protein U9M48_003624 [Paspalum notatum var. saurae]|uniref:Uncharacterized protein n=1 Tax=Paspalum notatum var. saurae TaxID=547442 RepID=A0AAQ3SH10_PASNO
MHPVLPFSSQYVGKDYETSNDGSDFDGGATRPARVVGSAMRYGDCPSGADRYEQRRIARNPVIGPSGVSPRSSYPRRIPTCKSETSEADRIGPKRGPNLSSSSSSSEEELEVDEGDVR